MKIYEHKTGKAKPAVVFFEREIGSALKHFNDKILPITQNSGSIDRDKEYFFVSMNGRRITQQGVQNSLNFLLKDIGGKTVKITSTKSRIAAATHIATSNPAKSQIVADYMGHQPSTADKYYREIGGGSHLKGAYEAIKPVQDR